MSSHKKVKKYMTYEKIGNELDISPQQVHKIEKEAINKMISGIVADSRFNVFDTILELSSFFGVDPHQIYGKLNKENKGKLYEYIQNHHGINMDEYFKRD